MTSRCPVTIATAANGFIVREDMRDLNCPVSQESFYVFNTMEGLTKWLEEHFTPTEDKPLLRGWQGDMYR